MEMLADLSMLEFTPEHNVSQHHADRADAAAGIYQRPHVGVVC